jgi:hypothetical protein
MVVLPEDLWAAEISSRDMGRLPFGAEEYVNRRGAEVAEKTG